MYSSFAAQSAALTSPLDAGSASRYTYKQALASQQQDIGCNVVHVHIEKIFWRPAN